MKRLNPVIMIVLSSLLIISIGCASNQSVSKSDTDITEKHSTNYWTLEDFLRRANGVQLSGTQGNMQVIIRGHSSINSSSQPLYVIDGQKAGRNFSQVSNMFSRGDIVSVKVLPASAASQYGIEGSFGVIEIESKYALNNL